MLDVSPLEIKRFLFCKNYFHQVQYFFLYLLLYYLHIKDPPIVFLSVPHHLNTNSLEKICYLLFLLAL